MRRPIIAIALLSVAAGCGSSTSRPPTPTIQPAHQFELTHFTPTGAIRPGRPTRLSFAIETPSGATLTTFRRGAGPHTGVHLIVVRDDLASIVHRHPPIAADGTIADSIVFPRPGRYRVLVDVYPNLPGQQLRNFQLHREVTVAGSEHRITLPPFAPDVTVDGFRFAMSGGAPRIRLAQPAYLNVHLTDAAGQPVTLKPWFGALAHAIFFHVDNLDYFHTHVCSAGLTACTSILGGPRISGTSTRPGLIRVGVLLPEAGTWRLFLQCRIGTQVLTAPYTLHVR